MSRVPAAGDDEARRAGQVSGARELLERRRALAGEYAATSCAHALQERRPAKRFTAAVGRLAPDFGLAS
jgi:hypothetical protein